MQKLGAKGFLHLQVIEGLHHAEDPLIAHGFVDFEGQVAGAQSRVTIFLLKEIRSAEPAGKK